MDKKKSVGVLMILATAIAGGSYAISLDFSNTMNQISGDTISGDTFIGGLLDEKKIAEAGLDIVCNLANIPEGYEETCKEWNSDN